MIKSDFIVNVLEVNRQDEITNNILTVYQVQAEHKLKAIGEAGRLWKDHELYQTYRHNYFLQAISR